MENDINTIEKTFFSSLGNGVKAGAALETMIKSVVTSRDTTVLVRAMDRARNDKNDEQAARTIAMVVSAIWPGAKLRKDKNSVPTIKIEGVQADQKALARLAEATTKGLSIRHSAYRKTVKGETAKPDFDLIKASTSLAKREISNGVTKAAALAALAAAYDTAVKSAK